VAAEPSRQQARSGPAQPAEPSALSQHAEPSPAAKRETVAASAPARATEAAPVAIDSSIEQSVARNETKKPRAHPTPKVDVTRLPAHDAFWDSPAMKEVWDVDHMTTADEVRLGRALHEMILHFQKPNTDGPWTARVEDAAEPLLKTVNRKDIPYTFTVLDSPAVNAFSHPGGFVYVSRGLFDLIGEDENYMLQFVVGHEIAHVDLQHAIACLRDEGVKKLEMGTLAKFYLIIIPFGYLDNQDFEADRWVFERMQRLDHSRLELLAFLRRFERYARAHGFENERGKPDVSANSSPLDNHLRAHVIARSRLKQLSSLAPLAASPTK
jgi:hypothetical protein